MVERGEDTIDAGRMPSWLSCPVGDGCPAIDRALPACSWFMSYLLNGLRVLLCRLLGLRQARQPYGLDP